MRKQVAPSKYTIRDQKAEIQTIAMATREQSIFWTMPSEQLVNICESVESNPYLNPNAVAHIRQILKDRESRA